MLSFVAQRIVKGAIVLLAIIVLNFFLIRLAPGDPAVVMAGEAGAGDQIFVTQLREKFGLDRPLPEQLFLYVKGILSLDLGFSFRQQTPVSKLIMDRLPATLLLTMTAFAISLLLGILLGTLAARWAGTWADTAITVLALVFYATPLFWIALIAILLFSVALDWLPSFGYETVGANYTGLAHMRDVGAHLIMPAMTIGLFFMATYARMTRGGEAARFRQDRACQGAQRQCNSATSRAAQCPAAGRDLGRPAFRHLDRRRGADRNGVRLARDWPPDV
jgi:peptide/nickel transport system permease protein